MTTVPKLGTQTIGAAGELFVQYQLLKRGIDSARLTTDSGIDLVMYVPGTCEAHTVQVKAAIAPYQTRGTPPMLIGWKFPRTCKAQWLAAVDLSRDRSWLFRIEDALRHAQGKKAELVELYWRLELPRGPIIRVESDFDQYQFDVAIDELLQGRAPELP
jgi:hypothetical protein